ncbi:MAG: Exodeoxyribonuclease 7 small subunit [Firmicutes bacterium ADurb.Bin300]|nr:MAG: Exodeoxyribonuclease 7 small subunit [Firmicutes bacterium ADurb.Bin300]
MKTNKDMTFEQSMKRLEEIVKLLENGNLPLEDSLQLFEEGTALVRKSEAYLDFAQQKITQLISIEEAKE